MTLDDWLKQNHYRESTARATRVALRAAQAAFDKQEPLPRTALSGAARILTYANQHPRATDLKPEFTEWLKDQGVLNVERLPQAAAKARVRPAVSLDERRWYRLHDKLEKSDVPEDLVLFVVLRSGLRIGDVLRTPIERVREGLNSGVLDIERKGGTFIKVPVGDNEEAWKRLLKATKKRSWACSNIAHFVCHINPSPLPADCAYQRVYRRIKYYQTDLNCKDSLYLHRLRRTIAVQALRATDGDIVKVQQMLGHRDIKSTQKYTDELQVEGIASLQSQLFKRKKGS